MGRLSARQARKALEFCIVRDGRRCNICHRDLPLILEHKDNDATFNPVDGSNWQAACKGCNARKDPRGPGRPKIHLYVRESERVRESESARERESERMISPELAKNGLCEGKFRRWVWGVIESHTVIDANEVINGGAEVAGCSPQTARRYLDKMCSIAGDFLYSMNEDGVRVVKKRGRAAPSPGPATLPSVLFSKDPGVKGGSNDQT